jgi:sortase A
MRRAVKLLHYGLATVGVVALGYWLAVFLSAKFFQIREERNFARELQQPTPAPGSGRAPAPVYGTPVAPPNGSVVGRLAIPRIGVSVIVVEGVNAKELDRAAGYIPGTAMPGEPGNVAIAAHRDTFFRPLQSIQRNDTITLNTLQGAYRYRVMSTRVVKPKDVQVLAATKGDTLTLVTCYPFSYFGSAPDRFIVKAQRDASPRASTVRQRARVKPAHFPHYR